MKLLTATSNSQGARANDFNFCVEGELVWVGLICSTDEADPDGGCGCGRAFSGLSSHRATTTAQVTDLPLSRDDVVAAFAGYLDSAGYGLSDPAEIEEDVDHWLELVATWDVGTVIERRLDYLRPRVRIR